MGARYESEMVSEGERAREKAGEGGRWRERAGDGGRWREVHLGGGYGLGGGSELDVVQVHTGWRREGDEAGGVSACARRGRGRRV